MLIGATIRSLIFSVGGEVGELYEKAEAFARLMHGDVLSKYGRPFIEHPLAVADQFDDETTKAATVLHDVIEKTSATVEDLIRFFGLEIASIVSNLTVLEGESQESVIRRALLDHRSAAIRLVDYLNHADIRNWKDTGQLPDFDSVGKYIDKAFIILRELSIFRSSTDNSATSGISLQSG